MTDEPTTPTDSSQAAVLANALGHLRSLVVNGPWISDGDPQMPVDICSYCRHDYSLAPDKAHFKGCEWLAAKKWLDKLEPQPNNSDE